MGTISLQIPQIGVADTTEDVKVANNFTTIQTTVNGNIDSTNIAATMAQSAVINQSGQTVKGSSIIATSEGTSSATPVFLATADQVQNIVLSAAGLLTIYYMARVIETVLNSGVYFLQINGTTVAVPNPGQTSFVQVGGGCGASGASKNQWITTHAAGIGPLQANTGSQIEPTPVTTGLVLGSQATNAGTPLFYGGPCTVTAAAGTYTVAVKYAALSGGTMTADNRRLYVKAESFA